MKENPHYFYIIVMIYITPLCIMSIFATIWNHYDTSPLRGPYVFRSKDGKLVAQLNSTLSIDTGAKFRDVFENLDNIVVTDH